MSPRAASIAIVSVLAVGGIAFFATATRPKPNPVSAPAEAPAAPARGLPAAPEAAPGAAVPLPGRLPEARRRTAPAPSNASSATPVSPDTAAIDVATLHVESDVPDAQVFVDRTFVGKTPLTTSDVKPGPHRLNVSAPGFEGVARDIDVKPGSQDVTIKLREVRLDASLNVIHKHRIGSCKGRLVATPDGLQYETTDRDDAFRSSLLDLDTFEVDYLQKNLRIKSKTGKRYDFTDPDGNADRLFVFHRDVQKARERLQKGDTAP